MIKIVARYFLGALALGLLVIPTTTLAADPEPTCVYGNFEAKLPGVTPDCIDDFLDSNRERPLTTLVGKIYNIFLGLIVATGLIMVTAAGYFYMTAGGNADQMNKAKKMVVAALSGILLAMAAKLILGTINPAIFNEPDLNSLRPPAITPTPPSSGGGSAGQGASGLNSAGSAGQPAGNAGSP